MCTTFHLCLPFLDFLRLHEEVYTTYSGAGRDLSNGIRNQNARIDYLTFDFTTRPNFNNEDLILIC